MILCVAFLMGFTMTRYLFFNPEDKYVYKKETALEGRYMDESLIGEVADTVRQYNSLENVPRDNIYNHVAHYMNRSLGTYMSLEETGGNYSLKDMTEDNYYQTRQDILQYLYDSFHLSDDEKKYWEDKESQIDKPFVWYANEGIRSMRVNYQPVTTLIAMIIGICLSGIFAAEHSFRTDSLILCTKGGRNTVLVAKLLAGEIFSFMAGMILLASAQISHIIFNGFHGIHAPCQLLVPISSYPYSSGKMLLIYTGIYLIACMLIGSLAMLLSCLFKNVVVAAGIISVFVSMDLFLAFPAGLRTLSQLRYLTPIQVLSNASMTDPRLWKIGESFLTTYQQAGILYTALIGLFCFMTVRTYRKWTG